MLGAASAGVQTPGSTAAAITGRITDATGAVLSGVTVALSGDALMGTRTRRVVQTASTASLRVPPGEYSLVFQLSGLHEDDSQRIHVGPGFTATVDVTLSVEGVQTMSLSPGVLRLSTGTQLR
jgi:hypothetical protein